MYISMRMCRPQLAVWPRGWKWILRHLRRRPRQQLEETY